MDGEGNQNRTGPRLIAGRYATLGVLGRGGMGVVWRAEDRVIGRQVALKELPLPWGAGSERAVFVERVLREARTAGRLNHPAVVTVYDVLSEHAAIFIVMELVEGPTLADVIAREGPLPSDRVVALGMRVLAALETAHAAGIVHRDVKPSNIMVLPGDQVKLADFGIAQALDDQSLTGSGIMGSPGYLAPELFAGSGPSPASDLWALGVTLFHAAEGAAPFHRDTTAATMYAVMHDDPQFQRSHGPLVSVITGLLTRSANNRLTGPQTREMLSSVTHPSSRPDQLGEQVTESFGEATTRVVDAPTSMVGPARRSTLPQDRWQNPLDADSPGVGEPILAPTPVPWHTDWTPKRSPARRKIALVAGAVALVAVLGVVTALLLKPGALGGTAAAQTGASTVTATAASATLTTKASGSAGTSTSSAVQQTSAGGNAGKTTLAQGAGSLPTPSLSDPGQPVPPATTSSSSASPRRWLALTRYMSPDGAYHFSGTDNVATPSNFKPEFGVGKLVASPEPGTQKLYTCQVRDGGQDLFTTADSTCDGQLVKGVLGYIFSSPPRPGDVETAPLYRCYNGTSHYDTMSGNCEVMNPALFPERTLGYVTW